MGAAVIFSRKHPVQLWHSRQLQPINSIIRDKRLTVRCLLRGVPTEQTRTRYLLIRSTQGGNFYRRQSKSRPTTPSHTWVLWQLGRVNTLSSGAPADTKQREP